MPELKANAGIFDASAFTDGSPIWVKVKDIRATEFHHLQLEDLHALRFVIDRMIVQIEAHQNEQASHR